MTVSLWSHFRALVQRRGRKVCVSAWCSWVSFEASNHESTCTIALRIFKDMKWPRPGIEAGNVEMSVKLR
jgi:hypothetical protein